MASPEVGYMSNSDCLKFLVFSLVCAFYTKRYGPIDVVTKNLFYCNCISVVENSNISDRYGRIWSRCLSRTQPCRLIFSDRGQAGA